MLKQFGLTSAALAEGFSVRSMLFRGDLVIDSNTTDLSTKLLGAGWRGRPNQPMNNAQLLVPDATESGGTNLNCQGTGSSLPPAFATFTSALNNIIPRIVRSTHITMLEEIPVRERNMDGIQARIVRHLQISQSA
jgi:hypothetical protein